MFLLVPIVDCDALDFVSVGVGRPAGYGATFFVRGYRDPATTDHSPTFFGYKVECVLVDFRIGTGVRRHIASYRIVLAIKGAHPCAVEGVTVSINAVDQNLRFEGKLPFVSHRMVPSCPVAELRFRLIQFPLPHEGIGEAGTRA